MAEWKLEVCSEGVRIQRGMRGERQGVSRVRKSMSRGDVAKRSAASSSPERVSRDAECDGIDGEFTERLCFHEALSELGNAGRPGVEHPPSRAGRCAWFEQDP